jgi:hypothetical protein
VQVALGGDRRAVTGDLPEHVDRYTSISHPGRASVAQVVAAQMFVAELGDDLVPVGGVVEHGRGDPTAARSGEDPCRWVVVNRIEALFYQWTDLFNERDGASPFALRAFVNQPAWIWCGLPRDRPGPGIAIDIGISDAGDFADPGRGAGGEDDNVAPALEVIGEPGN